MHGNQFHFSGPKFAKPVTKPQPQPHSSIGVSSNISSPSPRPMTSPLPSKLPQPTSGSAGVGSKIPAPSPLRKSRIPSAPRYNPPQVGTLDTSMHTFRFTFSFFIDRLSNITPHGGEVARIKLLLGGPDLETLTQI